MVQLTRRRFLQVAATTTAGVLAGCGGGSAPATPVASYPPPPPLTPEALLADALQRSFNYFWQTTDVARGLAPDYWPDPASASIAAMGFAFSAVPIGVEHGWVVRAAAAQRVRGWLEFLRDAPQGTAPTGCTGYRGFFYHFLDMTSGTRYRDSELSTVDTALLLMGARFCGQYFNGTAADEVAIRTISDGLCERVEWNWAQANGPGICMGWRPETGFLSADWIGYNEAIPVYLLALGSQAHAVGTDAWAAWTSGYDASWGKIEGIEHLTFGPLFGHHFTQCWVDLRGVSDAYLRARGIDYFENTRRAALSQIAYATANPLGWAGYGPNVWGLSACDGPYTGILSYQGVSRQFHTYAGRGVFLNPGLNLDDGTITPSAALGCLPFLPDQATAAAAEMYRRYGAVIYGQYGFLDSFNPSFQYDVPLLSGRRVGELGWVDSRYYGITQGPLITMLENQHSGLQWQVMQRDPVIRLGLQRAGFSGGWLG